MALRQNHYLKQTYFLLGNIESEKENYELAFYYWKESSQYNYYLAFDNLGWLYYNGHGVSENNLIAKYYFEKALSINRNDDFALFYIGMMYEYGYGVDKNMHKALQFLKKSADLGNDDAKSEVGKIQMNKKSLGLWINGEEI